MWRRVLVFSLFVLQRSWSRDVTCDDRNTALLETRNLWRIPGDAIRCVDVRSLGNKTSVPSLDGLQSASVLQADHMRLRTMPDFILVQLPNLQVADFSGNRLRKIARKTFERHSSLDTLLLNDNEIMLPKTPFLNSSSLETLFLSNNKIRRLRHNTFLQLQNLIKLYLDRNLLSQVSPNVFNALKQLQYLHLGSNQLKVLPQITFFRPEAVLIVKGNPFGRINVTKT